jgi:hypothetical protein
MTDVASLPSASPRKALYPRARCRIVWKSNGCTLEFGSIPRDTFPQFLKRLKDAIPNEHREYRAGWKFWWIADAGADALITWVYQTFEPQRVVIESQVKQPVRASKSRIPSAALPGKARSPLRPRYGS